jgi:hypothetical protein
MRILGVEHSACSAELASERKRRALGMHTHSVFTLFHAAAVRIRPIFGSDIFYSLSPDVPADAAGDRQSIAIQMAGEVACTRNHVGHKITVQLA